MADMETDADNKRKRSENSSVSDIEKSVSEESKGLQNKKKKKKTSTEKMSKLKECSDSEMDDDDLSLAEQLKEINIRLSKSITRDDNSLKQMIKDTFKQMKEEFLHSVSHRIDILEGKLFDKEVENDKLKEKVELLEKENETIREQNTLKTTEIENDNQKLQETVNNLEQYGRRNSVRIFGIPEVRNETILQTAQIAAEAINQHIPDVTIRRYDIDIAHRVNSKKGNKLPRPIIMKFVSRMTRDAVFFGRKKFKGSNIFINEDLTPINNHILTCVRKKQPDEVDMAWFKNGCIHYKHKDKSVHEVKYEDFQHWDELKWPNKKTASEVVDTVKKNK